MARLAAFLRLLLVLAIAGACSPGTAASARETHSATAIAAISVADLPPEARHTLQLIVRGGPFPYAHKDGATFGNFEKRLPLRERGYYREYTVPTPGSRDRGARRIVAGETRGSAFGEYYYTADHYQTWRRIVQP